MEDLKGRLFKMSEKDLYYVAGAVDTLPKKAREILYKLLDQVITD